MNHAYARVGSIGLARLIQEIVDAGDEAHRIQQSGALRVRDKVDQSPVTEADEKVETRLRTFLATHYADAAFLGEESGKSGNQDNALAFVVDPIDGTRAFVRGFPTWSVLVGIEWQGEPQLGIAYLPAEKNLFVGIVGEGTTENGRPVRMSQESRIALSTVCHGTVLQFAEANAVPALERVARKVRDIRGFGDFAGYRAVLRGEAEASFEPAIQHWDVSAPAAIMRAAGGTFCAWDGTPSVRKGTALATNGKVEAELLSILASTKP